LYSGQAGGRLVGAVSRGILCIHRIRSGSPNACAGARRAYDGDHGVPAMINDELAVAARDKCAVVGIGSTEFSRDSGRSVLSLATEASAAALADAGLSAADVEGIVGCDQDTVTPFTLAAALGASNLAYWAQTGPGGVAPCMMM